MLFTRVPEPVSHEIIGLTWICPHIFFWCFGEMSIGEGAKKFTLMIREHATNFACVQTHGPPMQIPHEQKNLFTFLWIKPISYHCYKVFWYLHILERIFPTSVPLDWKVHYLYCHAYILWALWTITQVRWLCPQSVVASNRWFWSFKPNLCRQILCLGPAQNVLQPMWWYFCIYPGQVNLSYGLRVLMCFP